MQILLLRICLTATRTSKLSQNASEPLSEAIHVYRLKIFKKSVGHARAPTLDQTFKIFSPQTENPCKGSPPALIIYIAP